MKKKLLMILLSCIIGSSAFCAKTIEGSESAGFYMSLGSNPSFIGFSITVEVPFLKDKIKGFSSESYLNGGSCSYDHYVIENDQTVLDSTISGVFLMFGENFIYNFLNFSFVSLRTGVGVDVGIYKGAGGEMDFGAMTGIVLGAEFLPNKLISIVCDIRPSLNLYTGIGFAAPFTISVRLNNDKIKI